MPESPGRMRAMKKPVPNVEMDGTSLYPFNSAVKSVVDVPCACEADEKAATSATANDAAVFFARQSFMVLLRMVPRREHRVNIVLAEPIPDMPSGIAAHARA